MSIDDIEVDLTVMSNQSKPRLLKEISGYADASDGRHKAANTTLGLLNEAFPPNQDLPRDILELAHDIGALSEEYSSDHIEYMAAIGLLETATTPIDDKALLSLCVYFPADVPPTPNNLLARLQQVDATATRDQFTFYGEVDEDYDTGFYRADVLLKCRDNAQAMAFKLAF